MAKQTPLQRAAAEQDDAVKQKKARGILSGLAALLGLAPTSEPAAKMSKHTKTTKTTETHEEDTPPPEDTEAPEDSTDGGSAEEEEGEAAEEEEAEGDSDAGEEAAASPTAPIAAAGANVAKPRGSMIRDAYAKADAAYLAAVPEEFRAAAALRMPSRLARAAKQATGAKSLDGAMGALSALPLRAAANAKIEADVSALKANDRKRRIDDIVTKARTDGKAGATSPEGRASLRAIGMAQGSKFLRAHVAALPTVAPTRERVPGKIAGEGPPTNLDQKAMLERSRQGLDAKDAETFDAIAAEKIKGMNGAAAHRDEEG